MATIETMTTKQAELKKMTEEALATLCNSLEQGKSEQLIKYLNVMSRFPKYSFGNLLLILVQKPDARRVMGYQSWKQLGRYVKKNEKGIRIWAPMNVKQKNDRKSGTDSLVNLDEDSQAMLIFRPVCVFDESQTDGKPLANMTEVCGNPGAYLERLKQFATKLHFKVGYSDELRGDGVSKCGEILIRLGLNAAVEFHVLAHEIAHEMIHAKEIRKGLSKKQAETEAEAVAYVVSKSIGLQTGTASSDYIQLWNGKKDTVCDSLAVIQKTAAEITSALI